jgi:hypothetical protein
METLLKTKSKARRCTCDAPSEYNSPRSKWNRHLPECAKSPDLEGFLWYAHSGEIEGGGVFVNPNDRSIIYLLVKGYLCPVSREDEWPL